MAKIGKNILDNLTTGMYSDSKVIYREYIKKDKSLLPSTMYILQQQGSPHI